MPQGSDDSGSHEAGRAGRAAAAASTSKNARRCRVDGCDACLLKEKKFYRRSRCCQQHARELQTASTDVNQVVLDGEPRRFCQQCCGFHELNAFDGSKRSCRERLEAHNTRQREKWTVGGRRRGKGDDEDSPSYQELPSTQLQRFLSADQSAAAGVAFGGGPVVQMPHQYISQDYSVSFEGMRRSEDMNLWAPPVQRMRTPPPPLQGGGMMGGMSPGSGGTPALRPRSSRRTMRTQSEKNPGWASAAVTTEAQAYWDCSTGQDSRNGLPHVGGGNATYTFNALPNGGGGEWAVFKHNSCEQADMAIDGSVQLGWQRHNALKRLSADSAPFETPHKRQSLDGRTPLERDDSNASAASGGWPRQGDAAAAARLGQQRASFAGEALRPADLGLHNDDEARAFAEQAPDPLWLAQRLVGGALAAKTRPEYSYGRQFRGFSMDSTTARLADSLDAVVAQVAELGHMSDAQLQGPLWAEAAATPQPPALSPPLPQQQPQLQPQQHNAFNRRSGPAAYNPALLADMSLGCGWDTNEGTLASVMANAQATGAMKGETRHGAGSSAGWPHLLNSFGEVSAAPAPNMGYRSLAAAGGQLSAPPLMQR